MAEHVLVLNIGRRHLYCREDVTKKLNSRMEEIRHIGSRAQHTYLCHTNKHTSCSLSLLQSNDTNFIGTLEIDEFSC